MIRFELKKIWRSRIFLIFLGALVVLNIIKIVSANDKYSNDDSFSHARTELYEQVEGIWNMDTINYIIETYHNAADIVAEGNYSTEPDQDGTYTGYIFGDFSLFGEVYEKMNYMYNYGSVMEETLQKAQNNIGFYKEKNNAYNSHESSMIFRLYSGRSIPAFYDTDGAYALICYDFSSVLVLLLMILGLSSVFTYEKETEMQLLLETSKNGGKRLITAKISASVITSAALTILFTLIDIAAFTVIYNIKCFDNPLYSISAFQNTPLSCSIGSYLLIDRAYRICGMIIMSLFFLFISKISSDDILSFCGCFAAALLLIFIGGKWNPIILLTSRELFLSFNTINIFGFPTMQYIIILSVALAAGAILSFLIYRFGGKMKYRKFSLKVILRKGKELLS